jgi:chromate transporter
LLTASPPSISVTLSATGSGPSLLTLFLTFLKIGAILYGSGYVLLAFIQNDFVHGLGWLSSKQVLDAVAIGQITPGPVFTTATFIGYLVLGVPGALLATLAIFLPAFIYTPLVFPLIPRLRRSRVFSAFLDGVNASALGLMAAVSWTLGRAAIVDPFTALLAVAATTALVRFKLNAAWLIAAGGISSIVYKLGAG